MKKKRQRERERERKRRQEFTVDRVEGEERRKGSKRQLDRGQQDAGDSAHKRCIYI